MFLKKIEIKGFKSFANKTEFIFPEPISGNKGITAIVGPNGSGKSNVVDAVRWVLGEQSLKLLRGKKSQDVIFHGSKAKGRLGMAEVSILIDNKDKVLPIEYSELMITRRLYQSGESEYYVNKSKAKLSQIIMLLAKANFGQKSFSIVGQGMIDYILHAGMKERKEFFDEAVGVKQYQLKRHYTINDLKRSKINLEQIKIGLTEMEPHLKLLSRQAKKLEKREKIKKELLSLQIVYYSHLYFKIKNDLDKLYSLLKNEENIEKEISEKLLNYQKKMTVLSEETSQKDRFNVLKEKFEELNNQKNKTLKELAFIKSEINARYKEAGKIDLAWMTRTFDDLLNKKENIKKEYNLLREKQKDIKESIDNEKKKLKIVEDKINNIKDDLGKIETKNNFVTEKNLQETVKEILKKQYLFLDFINSIQDLSEISQAKKMALDIKESLEKITRIKKEGDKIYFEQKLNRLSKEKDNLFAEKERILSKINSLLVHFDVNKEKEKMLQESIERIGEELKRAEQEIKSAKKEDKKAFVDDLKKQELKNKEKIAEIEKEISLIKKNIDNFNKIEQEKKEKLFLLQEKIQSEQLKINSTKNKINELKVEKARIETKKEILLEEIKKEIGSIDKLDKKYLNSLIDEQKIFRLKNQLDLIGGIDPEVIDEYKKVKEKYDFLSGQVVDIEESIEKMEKIIIDLDKLIKNKFNKSFEKINQHFDKYFKVLFGGGEAKLIKNFIEKTDPKEKEESDETEGGEVKKKKKKDFEIGIDIQIAPKGKKLRDINIFSGGERSLTSIALICAIISINPSPFVILDEVDAALDEANSVRFAKILEQLSSKTQFVAITHNREIMEVAKVLYGVTMQDDGISKVLSLNLEDAQAKAK